MNAFYMAIRALRQALERFITGTKSTPTPAPKNLNTRSDLFTGKEADQLSQENRGAVVIPDGKEKVCPRAFDGNKNVTSISVPGSVKTILSPLFFVWISPGNAKSADALLSQNIGAGGTGYSVLEGLSTL